MSAYEFFLTDVTFTNGNETAQINNADSVFGAIEGSQVFIAGSDIPETLVSVDNTARTITLSRPWPRATAENVEVKISPVASAAAQMSALSANRELFNSFNESAADLVETYENAVGTITAQPSVRAFDGYVEKGTFETGTYATNDIVQSSNGKSYLCIEGYTADENSPQPADDTVHWFTWQGVTFDRLNYVDFGLFGHKDAGGRVNYFFNAEPTEKIDNQAAFERCRDFAITIGCRTIYIPEGCWYFNIDNDPIEIFTTFNIVGAGRELTQLFANFSNNPLPYDQKTALFHFSGCRGSIREFHIRSNSYLGVGLLFTGDIGDNQKMWLHRVAVYSCRWGVNVPEGECINQMSIEECRFDGNYFSGWRLISFQGEVYEHQAPIHFRNVILNGNGPTAFARAAIYTNDAGEQIPIATAENQTGTQMVFKGFANVQFIGGQLSGHGNPYNTSLCNLVQGSTFEFIGTDIEDIAEGYACTTDGTVIDSTNYELIEKDYREDSSGAAILVSSVPGFRITSVHTYKIRNIAFIKLMYGKTDNATIGAFNTDELQVYKYNVWDINNDPLYKAQHEIAPSLLTHGRGISPIAFDNMGNSVRNVVPIHIEMCGTNNALPVSTRMWQNGSMRSPDTDGWNLKYLSSHDQNLTSGHLFNEFDVSPFGTTPTENTPPEIKFLFITCTYSTYGDGRFVIQCFDENATVVESTWYTPANFSSNYERGGTVRFEVPTGTKKIRYGFVNSENYEGSMRLHWIGNFQRSPRFFLKVRAVVTDIDRYGNYEPPYAAAMDEYRVGYEMPQLPQISSLPSSASSSTASDVQTLKDDLNTLTTKFNSLLSALNNYNPNP